MRFHVIELLDIRFSVSQHVLVYLQCVSVSLFWYKVIIFLFLNPANQALMVTEHT